VAGAAQAGGGAVSGKQLRPGSKSSFFGAGSSLERHCRRTIGIAGGNQGPRRQLSSRILLFDAKISGASEKSAGGLIGRKNPCATGLGRQGPALWCRKKKSLGGQGNSMWVLAFRHQTLARRQQICPSIGISVPPGYPNPHARGRWPTVDDPGIHRLFPPHAALKSALPSRETSIRGRSGPRKRQHQQKMAGHICSPIRQPQRRRTPPSETLPNARI